MDSFLKRIKQNNASLFTVSKEMLVEMRRQFWTSYSNLDRWFDDFEMFVLEKGFATKVGDEVIFSDHMKRRIINIDESNLCLDGSDGNRGGRPALSIIAEGLNRVGTAQNKSSVTSTIMCGSNAYGETLPLHIVFSSDASNEENFTVNTDWITGLPTVKCLFGMDKENELSASVSVNRKGGSDQRVLKDILLNYVHRLYPDVADIHGMLMDITN